HGETDQGTGQPVPARLGAVSVPVNRKIIAPYFVRRTARMGEAAAEHEVPEAEVLADDKHGFLEGRLRAHGKNPREAHGPLVAHLVSLPDGVSPLVLADTLRSRRDCANTFHFQCPRAYLRSGCEP